MILTAEPVLELPVLFQESENKLTLNLQERIGPGTTDYTQLDNLPRINGKFVNGDHDGSYYGLVNAVQGRGLSDRNYSQAEKQKLFDLPTKNMLNDTFNKKANRSAMMELLDALKSKRVITVAVYNQIVDLL